MPDLTKGTKIYNQLIPCFIRNEYVKPYEKG